MTRGSCTLLVAACASALACAEPAPWVGGNLLVLVADDLGIDHVAISGVASDPPATPNVVALAERGVSFTNAYAPPVCAASRAAMLTGRHPLRMGLATHLDTRRSDLELPLDEVTLPEALAQGPIRYANAAIGKWHLSTYQSPHALVHPLASGFASHRGTLANLGARWRVAGVGTYDYWETLRDGVLGTSRTYATTATADDALERMAVLPQPWLLWVAFHAPHRPLHVPPPHLTRHPTATPIDRYRASIEALDREIGRILAAAPEHTTVVFVSDNGAPGDLVAPPFTAGAAKGTLHEAGMRVPLVVAGPVVAAPGRRCDALVQLIDLFPTLVELAGGDPDALEAEDGRALALDGVSLVPLLRDPAAPPVREIVFEALRPAGDVGRGRSASMVRDASHKLVRRCRGGRCEDALHRLSGVDEGEPLAAPLSPADARASERLRGALEALLATGGGRT